MKVTIIHYQKGLIFEGEADEVHLPMAEGEIGILPGHAEYFALLTSGKISVQGKSPFEVEIDQGWVRVKDESSLVLIR